MRKIKKINGYLVVKFNDRELREWADTGLGNFGVIDAELYTGCFEVDRSVMEYDSAETIEEAVEQAHGLESEIDIQAPTSFLIIKETDDSEELAAVDPEMMVNEWEDTLAHQIKSKRYPEINQETAQHELYGFMVALRELGMYEPDMCIVEPHHFEQIKTSCLDTGPTPIKLNDTVATIDYLKRQRDMASHNLFCCSANYGMTKPKEGYEEEWQKAVLDYELVEELIQLIEPKENNSPPSEYEHFKHQRETLIQAEKFLEPLIMETCEQIQKKGNSDEELTNKKNTLIFLAKAAREVCCRPTKNNAKNFMKLIELFLSDNLTIIIKPGENDLSRIEFVDKLFNTSYAEIEFRQHGGYWFIESYKFFQ